MSMGRLLGLPLGALGLLGVFMVYFFRSQGCLACHEVNYQIHYGDWKNWTGHVKIVDVEFNEKEQCFKAVVDGKMTDGKSPVDAVPALYFSEQEKFLQGYGEIKREFEIWRQAELD